ncbi:MAG: HAD family phosphatase [Cellvibrionaceae bacterium]
MQKKIVNKKLPLIIFDCDGVLVDSEDIANQVLVKHIQQLGVDITEDHGSRLYRGLSMSTILDKIKSQINFPLPEYFLENLQKETFLHFSRSLKAVSGVESVIIWLMEKGYNICVASSGSYDKLDLTLSITGLDSYFAPNIFSASEVQKGKPFPDLFLYAADQMGFAAEECIVIEDSLPGVMAASRANMAVFAYCKCQTKISIDQMSELGATIFHDMNELTSFFHRI